MHSVPSTPGVTEIKLGEEEGSRRIAFDIDPSLLHYDTDLDLYVVAMTAAEARQTATILLSMAEDVEQIAAARGKP